MCAVNKRILGLFGWSDVSVWTLLDLYQHILVLGLDSHACSPYATPSSVVVVVASVGLTD